MAVLHNLHGNWWNLQVWEGLSMTHAQPFGTASFDIWLTACWTELERGDHQANEVEFKI